MSRLSTENDLINVSLEKISDFPEFKKLDASLRIQLVKFCNLNCFFCHNEGEKVSKDSFDKKFLLKIIDASVQLGRNKFRFTGGEPLLYPDFEELITFLKDKYPTSDLGITTNGIFLKNFDSAFFDRLNKIDVSLHSLERDTYKSITGKDCLQVVLENIFYLKKLNFRNFSINVVVSKHNLHEVSNIIDFSQKNNIKLVLLDIIGDSSNDAGAIKSSEIFRRFGSFKNVEIKKKLYHPKCVSCKSKNICGEGDYLRLSAPNKLIPCMYRDDLFQSISLKDNTITMKKKLALGYRRIIYDDL